MELTDMERLALASDLTAKGTREDLAALDLKLLEPGKKYAVFFISLDK